MKTKLISIFALAIMVASCSNQELIDSDFQQPAPKQTSSIRSYEEALQIAQASIQMVDGQTQTRATSPRKISLSDSKVCLGGSITRSETGNDTLMYVFNFEDNQGFAVVSANRATEGLIAITESGYYNPDEQSEIDGFNYYMEMAKEYIRNMRGSGLDPIIPEGRDSFAIGHSYVGPYVTVNWGYSHPEGEFCPNGICGCSNTAAAQIMSYYECPSTTPITYDNRDVNYQVFDWAQMKAHQTGHIRNSNLCSSDDAHTSIARLCRQLGYIAGSNYSKPNSTSTPLTGTISAFQFFGYITNSWIPYSNASIKDTLDVGCPMLICGWDYNLQNVAGHVWVMDGYHEIANLHYWITRPYVGSDEEVAYLVDTTYSYLYHFNWGWYGENNGYFSYNVFNTELGEYDEIHQTKNYNFNSSVVILCPHPIITN